MPLELGHERGEEVLVVGRDLDAGPAGVDIGATDVDVDHAVVGACVDDGVEDLGQDERVDDVPLDLDQLGGHQVGVVDNSSAAASDIGISSSPIVGSSFSRPCRFS